MGGESKERCMARLPLSPSKVVDAWKEAAYSAQSAVGLAVLGDPHLVALALAELGGAVMVRTAGSAPGALIDMRLSAGELGLFLAEPADEDEILAGITGSRMGAGVVVAVDEGPLASHRVTRREAGIARVSFSPDPAGWAAVWEALLGLTSRNTVALGRQFPAMRRAAGRRLVGRTARQNGLVGAAFFVPGADMAVMTLNQLKMVLALAAMHEMELTQERALELLGVVGVGFGLRTLAREALAFLPGPGWILKGAIGYTGTLALGEAAGRYFEAGAPATPSRLVALFKRFKR
jgi:uncharacterized protein (DUF697 family)